MTAIGAAFVAAVIATFALILPGPGSTTPYPAPTASRRPTESPPDAPTMPELRYQDAETARRLVTALGFVPEMHTLTGEEMKVPTDWIVVGQGPAPGTLLKSTMPIEFYVTRRDMPVPSPTTASADPYEPAHHDLHALQNTAEDRGRRGR
ncbi:PASTA domain-containing protein [Microbispora sp. KK1-11]|uniref:PASTA domain-containing protein n=1 Tax=Microbispora sp. KK1-11 TaxID=2053005 RepID=UPI00163CF1C8|nr:PASTA domain-containing protein [Microbispora sp. KK1-11]